MFKEITDVFTWLNNAGVFAFLVVLISAVYKLVKPLLTRLRRKRTLTLSKD